jgi:hypothetical protein
VISPETAAPVQLQRRNDLARQLIVSQLRQSQFLPFEHCALISLESFASESPVLLREQRGHARSEILGKSPGKLGAALDPGIEDLRCFHLP